MGQTSSSSSHLRMLENESIVNGLGSHDYDYSLGIPDECLVNIFQFLRSGDRKRCSLVSRRWYLVEAQSRERISLDARSELLLSIPSIFSRYDSIAKISLRCDRKSESIGDESLILISKLCPRLTEVKIRSCRSLTNVGMSEFSKNCKDLKKFSCGSCTFGAKGINAVLEHSYSLEFLTVKRLRGIVDGEKIVPGVAALSLKSICLKGIYNGECFGSLFAGTKNLKTLKIFHCSGAWDKILDVIPNCIPGSTEIHMEDISVSDLGCSAISKCTELEILRFKALSCTNLGLATVADGCKSLRKLYIVGGRSISIGDDGLVEVARRCPELQDVVLIGMNLTALSLGILAENCEKLQKLTLCGSETIDDGVLSCIASKCTNLKKLCLKGCPVTDSGLQSLVNGCPNLMKVKVRKCRRVTAAGVDSLRFNRGSLTVKFDSGLVEQHEEKPSDGVKANENVRELCERVSTMATSSSNGIRSSTSKPRRNIFAGRTFVPCTFGNWSQNYNDSNDSLRGM